MYDLIGLSHLHSKAEGVGFEPTSRKSGNGFQDRRHSPLGHPSIIYINVRLLGNKVC
jgi:hypothetical protein